MLIAAIVSGLVAGAAHVLAGPDHLAAVAPLSVGKRRAGWQIGFRWGAGHSVGVVVIGALSLWLRELLPLNSLSAWTERIVGLTLVAVGLWSFRKALASHLHTHEHSHGTQTHSHAHLHVPGEAHPLAEERPHKHTHAALAIGALHGLAGSSHLLGIVPALAFPTTAQAVAYLAAFGAGTVAGMTCFSSLISFLGSGWMRRTPYGYRALMSGCSVLALGVGGYWLLG
jgi:ABC-type nickel/cobalt efflux system permease component RcnA